VTTTGPHPYEVGDVTDTSPGGFEGDVTGELVDLGERTDPASIGDVAGKVVLLASDVTTAPTQDSLSQDDLTALMAALKARGAQLVLSYDYNEDTGILPVLELFSATDIQDLRDRIAAGEDQVHVVGRPAAPSLHLLFDAVNTALPNGHRWHFDPAHLARVDSVYREPAGARRLDDQLFGFTDPTTGLSGATDHELVLPQTRTEYYTPGVTWSAYTDIGISDDWTHLTFQTTAPLAREAGTHGTSTWGSAPFGSGLPQALISSEDGKLLPWAYRQGGKVFTAMPFVQGPGPTVVSLPGSTLTGDVPPDTGTTTLYRGSTRIDGSDEPGTAGFSLPAGRTAYRLVTQASRPTELSPDVSAQWTFTSARTDPGKRSPLDLLTICFHLPLDAHNRAPAGHGLTGTVTVTRQPGSSGAAASTLSLQVSYDNGRTWHPATVSHSAAGTWSVRLPAGGTAGGHASLRATARSASGDTVSERITSAYALR
jgi:hypothetical protein